MNQLKEHYYTEGIGSRFIFGEWVVINPNNNNMKFKTQYKFD